MEAFGCDLTKYKINAENVGSFIEDCYTSIEEVDGNFGGWELEDDCQKLSDDSLYLVTSVEHICRPDKDGYIELKHLTWRGHEAKEEDVPNYRCFLLTKSFMDELISRCTKINEIPIPKVGEYYFIYQKEMGHKLREVKEIKESKVYFTTDTYSDIDLFDKWLLVTECEIKELESSNYDEGSARVFNKVLPKSPKAPTDSIAPLKPTETKQTTETKENTMSKVKVAAVAAVTANKTAGLEAAKLKVGKTANNLVAKMIKPKMPVGTKGFIDHPLAGIAIANAAKIAVNQMAGDNNKAQAIVDAMMTYSYFELVDKIDVEGMIDEMTEKFSGSAVDKIVTAHADSDIVID